MAVQQNKTGSLIDHHAQHLASLNSFRRRVAKSPSDRSFPVFLRRFRFIVDTILSYSRQAPEVRNAIVMNCHMDPWITQ